MVRMSPSTNLPRWILIPLVLSAAALLVAAGLALAIDRRVYPTAPDYRVASLGGLEYESMLGRPLHPAKNRVDAEIAAGLSRRELRLGRGEILFGAFISVSNDSPRAQPMARRFELRDEQGHVYRPLRLPDTNPYAYRARLIHPRTSIPQHGTPAADNLAATGRMLLFRVPSADYENGRFELLVHDPRQPAATIPLLVV
jgi:hypothetical protein